MERTGKLLKPGEAFTVDKEVSDSSENGAVFLHLADNSGWVPTRDEDRVLCHPAPREAVRKASSEERAIYDDLELDATKASRPENLEVPPSHLAWTERHGASQPYQHMMMMSNYAAATQAAYQSLLPAAYPGMSAFWPDPSMMSAGYGYRQSGRCQQYAHKDTPRSSKDRSSDKEGGMKRRTCAQATSPKPHVSRHAMEDTPAAEPAAKKARAESPTLTKSSDEDRSR